MNLWNYFSHYGGWWCDFLFQTTRHQQESLSRSDRQKNVEKRTGRQTRSVFPQPLLNNESTGYLLLFSPPPPRILSMCEIFLTRCRPIIRTARSFSWFGRIVRADGNSKLASAVPVAPNLTNVAIGLSLLEIMTKFRRKIIIWTAFGGVIYPLDIAHI